MWLGRSPPSAGTAQRGPAAPGLAPAVLEAVLERITYANEETGYTVARVATPVTRPGPAPGALVARADIEPPARRNPPRELPSTVVDERWRPFPLQGVHALNAPFH